jgi:hypothetical protein
MASSIGRALRYPSNDPQGYKNAEGQKSSLRIVVSESP